MSENFDLRDEVCGIVRDSLSCPCWGMGGGSVGERLAQEGWREALRARWERALRMAEQGSPEACRLLYLVGAELRFKHPRSGTVLRFGPELPGEIFNVCA